MNDPSPQREVDRRGIQELGGFGRRLIWILWPSFIVGGIGEVIFFTLFDPMELPFSDTLLPGGQTLGEKRLMVYTIGFFLFWAFAAASSALTCFFQRTSAEINRCPLTPAERPPGCPKREEAGEPRCG
jgi:hypothetical protein